MYFSRVRLHPEKLDIKQWKKLAEGNVYAAHQLLWGLFSEHQERSFLFRHEIGNNTSNNLPVYYVLSKTQPQLNTPLITVETKIYSPSLEVGQLFRFNLRANPVVAKFCGKDSNSARHDVLMDVKLRAKKDNIDPQQLWSYMTQAAVEWLQSRANSLGFSINQEKISVDSYQQHCLYKKSQKKPIQFSSIDYTGILQVKDHRLFEKTLFNGIGRAKAFGCGLMLIRPH